MKHGSQYDRLAERYDRRWADYNARSLALLRPSLSGADLGDVLDLGCGTGNLLPRLGEWEARVRSYTGVDASNAMLRAAAAKLAASNFLVTLEAADAASLPFAAASFDTVVSASALHDFAEPERAMGEVRRVLRPGGRLLLVDWSRHRITMRALGIYLRLTGDSFRRMYSVGEVLAMLSAARFRIALAERRAIDRVWELMVIEAVPK
jgi:ubiquinone/menaquinone biosynthesis C-methylase UbiE